jgi:hypothetical protein
MPDVYGLTSFGRTAIAQAMSAVEFWLAWGDLGNTYPETWGQYPPDPMTPLKAETLVRGNGYVDALSSGPVTAVASVVQGGVAFTPGADYVQNGNGIDWSPPGRRPVQNTAYQVTYRYRNESPTALIHELGRQKVKYADFLRRDPAGTLVFENERYSISPSPTNMLRLRFEFPSRAAPDADIFQLGLFTNVSRAAGVPAVDYLLPSQIGSAGNMLVYENIPPIERLPGKREYFDYLLVF